MKRLICTTMLALAASTAATAQDATAERLKQLEEQNRMLQRELDAARTRIRELEGGAGSGAAPAATVAVTMDPGSDPWGNPTAALRTLASKVKQDLLDRGQALPDSAAGEKVMQSYRQRAAKWIEGMAKFRQSVEWRVDVSEAIVVSTSPRELEVRVHVLNTKGALVGPGFSVKVPASAAPELTPQNAPGTWVLKAELVPNLRLNSDTSGAERANPFGDVPLIAPQLQCRLEYTVLALTRVATAAPNAPAPTTK